MPSNRRADTPRLKSRPAPAEIDIGRVIARRYEILEPLGRGAFGQVYRALDRELGEPVALKCFDVADDDESIEPLRQEIRMARRISHPNVIRVHDIGESDGVRYISMELVDGDSLHQVITRAGVLPVGQALAIFRQVAQGVHAAHRQGVVHCDLKPGNILLGAQGQAKVLDFGLAALADIRDPTVKGVLHGTPAYMAPEQVEGQRNKQTSDQYALGVILFEMLTGIVPFRGDTPLATALAHLSQRPDNPQGLNPAIPDWLGHVVLRCLEREPTDRFGSVAELLDVLERSEKREGERTTDTLIVGALPRRPFRGTRGILRHAPLLLATVAVMLAFPVVRRELAPMLSHREPVFADGVARITVRDFDLITGDPVTKMIAAALTEKLRSRLGQVGDVRVVGDTGEADSTTPEALSRLGVEHVLKGAVGRLGSEVKILFSVTLVPGREQLMTNEQTLQWDESWERIDDVAEKVAQAYLHRLDLERSTPNTNP